jgi:hypothetical protein
VRSAPPIYTSEEGHLEEIQIAYVCMKMKHLVLRKLKYFLAVITKAIFFCVIG